MRIYIVISICIISITSNVYSQYEDIDHWESVFYSDTLFRYWKSTQGAPDNNWRSIDFNDNNWNIGKGGIGYGDGDDLTIIESCISVLLRREFTIHDTSDISSAILNIDYDDAFVAYLNGIEIARSQGLTGDFPSYNQNSTALHEAVLFNNGSPENFIIHDTVLKTILKPDTNLLAIQVHNYSATSSDLSSSVFFSVGIKTIESIYLPTPQWFHPPVNIILPDNEPAWMNIFKPALFINSNYIESQKIFDVNSIVTIRITMSSSDYSSLVNNTTTNTYRRATLSYESPLIPEEIVQDVGIRLRGKAARNTRKKSFKITFREFGHDDREFHGLRKLNLNCDFQDPNLMRAKMCTELFNSMGVPAARTGYAKLYINNEYRGLFANYEEIDKVLLQSRFGDNNGNLYKCTNNASMQYRMAQDYDKAKGWGSELAYDLKTNEEENDYSDLANFIDVLNWTAETNLSKEIEKIFNVDRFLMYVACNVLLGAWDDYWILAKNYYFYNDLYSGKFNYIPHDFDGSLGTDWYAGNIAYRNVYNWSPNSGRPMVEKLLKQEKYRKKYTYYLYMLCSWPFSLEALEPEIDRTASLIRNTLINDPYWPDDHGWWQTDFDNSLDHSISRGNVKYGLKEYIQLRQQSALSQLENYPPFIDHVEHDPILPSKDDSVKIFAFVIAMNDIDSVQVVYKINDSEIRINMLDNGTYPDTMTNDNIFTSIIPPALNNNEVEYYILAVDKSGKTSRYPENNWLTYNTNYTPPKIYINEFLSDNRMALMDEFEEYDDWFELYNPGNNPVDLTNMYVTDDLSKPKKWKLKNLTIPANDFLLLWADNSPQQGNNHVGFRLEKNGEQLGLFDTDLHANIPIDTISFGSQLPDVSYGRKPDGGNEWDYFMLTNNITDHTTQVNKFALHQNYPNPFKNTTTIAYNLYEPTHVEISIYNITGQKITELLNSQKEAGNYSVTWESGTSISDGIYFCRMVAGKTVLTKKLILMR